MARKTNNTTATPTTPTDSTPTRARRSPDQIVADLQAKIDAVQRRAAAQAVKAAPEVKPLMLAVKALDKAIEAAEGNAELRRALDAARATFAEELDRMGLQAPRKRARSSAAA